MPHYSDGTEAKVGDVARGKPYNTDRVVEGVVSKITPDSESCNLVITWLEPKHPWVVKALVPAMEQINVVDAQMIAEMKHDYGETGAFELVHRREES